jgi:hypothetical protein
VLEGSPLRPLCRARLLHAEDLLELAPAAAVDQLLALRAVTVEGYFRSWPPLRTVGDWSDLHRVGIDERRC